MISNKQRRAKSSTAVHEDFELGSRSNLCYLGVIGGDRENETAEENGGEIEF